MLIVEVVRIDVNQPARLVSVKVPIGAIVANALEASGLVAGNECLTDLRVGIFSQAVSLHHPLATGDRVEIYAPLRLDPKEARLERIAT